MPQVLAAFGTPTSLDLSSIVMRLLVALACGAAIGFEREWRSHAAGLRTHILVCLSAAIVAILTIEIAHHPAFDREEVRLDPLRLVEAVTAGVAFLAAGMIVYSKGRVKGLTTGAGLWFAGSIGLSCGLGFWQIGLIATGFALSVLWLVTLLEYKIPKREDD
ncbi:preprotein translocase subunit TatA [Rhizobium sp. Root274]|uniref:MgtC/SapB family protein n=1 Tax=unclassified Rhizobium TaxID=2613769 RepID=UPI0007147C6E|nr:MULTISPECIES: MgtC/SapB family protein [unclassified Rhizobium]KQW27166.1 preprotein translocase subunit TatA [Rhizobium sp. Root1240]KRD26642.1 preprotein translocase subunit TatA [Rhizobium sp. Root274]